jgi:fucose 4-O-acetylase-like acetyltransferase
MKSLMSKKHYTGIDFIKGCLILFVIAGHILQGTLSENPARYMIYGFHMPLFVAISGFLIDYEKLAQIKFFDLLKKYLSRVIIPWTLAVVVYYIVTSGTGFNFKDMVLSFLFPYYHLWYVPAILLYIFSAWLLVRLKLPLKILVVIALLVSAMCYYFGPALSDSSNIVARFVVITVRPQNFFFFCLGMVVKNYRNIGNWRTAGLAVAAVLAALAYGYCFSVPIQWLSALAFFAMNTTLILLLVKGIINDRLPRSTFVEWLGINSLPVYLWHMIPVLFVMHFISPEIQLYTFYGVCLIAEVAFIRIIKVLTFFKSLNKLAFGGN